MMIIIMIAALGTAAAVTAIVALVGAVVMMGVIASPWNVARLSC